MIDTKICMTRLESINFSNFLDSIPGYQVIDTYQHAVGGFYCVEFIQYDYETYMYAIEIVSDVDYGRTKQEMLSAGYEIVNVKPTSDGEAEISYLVQSI